MIAWNSAVRRNDPEKVKLKTVPRQQGPEKGFVPTSRLQPVAGVAHVDQDEVSSRFTNILSYGNSPSSP